MPVPSRIEDVFDSLTAACADALEELSMCSSGDEWEEESMDDSDGALEKLLEDDSDGALEEQLKDDGDGALEELSACSSDGASDDEDQSDSDDDHEPPIRVAEHSRQICFRTDQHVNTEAIMLLNELYREEAAIKKMVQEGALKAIFDEGTTLTMPDLKGFTSLFAQAYVGQNLSTADHQILASGVCESITNYVERAGDLSNLVGWQPSAQNRDLTWHAKYLLDAVWKQRFLDSSQPPNEYEPNNIEMYFLSRALSLPEERLIEYFEVKRMHSRNIHNVFKLFLFKKRLGKFLEEGGSLEEFVRVLEQEEEEMLHKQWEEYEDED